MPRTGTYEYSETIKVDSSLVLGVSNRPSWRVVTACDTMLLVKVNEGTCRRNPGFAWVKRGIGRPRLDMMLFRLGTFTRLSM